MPEETPGTVFGLSESLGYDSSKVSRNFTAFQDGSNTSAMSAKHMAQFTRPTKDGLAVQGPIHHSVFESMADEVRSQRVSKDKNFKGHMTNTVHISDQATSPRFTALGVKKRDDVGSGRGVILNSTAHGSSIDAGKTHLRVLKSNSHLDSTV
ncbi:hypothetical protein [Thalassomonas actiniarum]|uniref:Uncharacterized protein n=1 Tax=Thalassomonas actiniarum TaxID=485447 RepID=A0AAF0C610_9GAMM|nr:hypothetical protein [Thalassomonas actiniarum]WDE02098.1 hypothetical protein SG35_030510 [Thalassomonas actiniarum]